jgi:NAD(P)H-dependent FMN reductase
MIGPAETTPQPGRDAPGDGRVDVLLLCGSPSERSHTHALLRYLAVLLARRGARPLLWCLRERVLPAVDPSYHADPSQHPDEGIRTFVEVVDLADAVVLGTPLYHGSYSSTLKNALDNLRYDALRGKPVALVSNSGGGRATTQACEHLRGVVRTLFGYTTQCQIGTYNGDYTAADGGVRLASEEIGRRCAVLADELLEFASMLAARTRHGDGEQARGTRREASGTAPA